MAVTSDDMKKAITELLEQRGVINSLKAHLRAEVFTALTDKTNPIPPPPLSKENSIINSLILEYFRFNNYKYSASVLTAESGHSAESQTSNYLQQELGLERNNISTSVPLLYSLVEYFTQQKGEKNS